MKKKYPLLFNMTFSKVLVFFILILTLFSTNIFSQNCSTNAGILNEVICINDNLTLSGNVPSPIQGNTLWQQLSGSTVVIVNPNNPVTEVLGYSPGNTYVFRYSVICGDGVESYQDKTVTVQPITIADAGQDLEFCPDTQGNITVIANSPLHSGEVGTWEIITPDNPAGLTIDFPNSSITTLTIPSTSCGVTTIAWVINGQEYSPGLRCTSRSEINITNLGGVTPVSAGNDQELGNCYTTTQSTSLFATYGGCLLNGQQGTWSFVSGPSFPIFKDKNDSETTASNLIEGSYILKWTTVGPCSSASDTMIIEVPPASQDVTTFPNSKTEEIFLCANGTSSITLDGLVPTFANEEVFWEQVDEIGAGAVVIPTTTSTTFPVT
ncbi:hypothetical protein [Tenacibaculum aestuariivivum]|uniref:hypothetical protein n=1 Tax=Tenacibaculum aestuariivivum TaxID=2006131 RepID=UPI003AB17534